MYSSYYLLYIFMENIILNILSDIATILYNYDMGLFHIILIYNR